MPLVLVLLLVTACGGGGDVEESDATSEQHDVTTLLAGASRRIESIQSLKFSLQVEGSTYIDNTGTIQLLTARGTLARPNLVDVQFQVRLLGTQTASIRMISAGDQAWTTDLISGNWGPAPDEFGYDPSLLFDTANGLGPVMGSLTDSAIVGQENIADRPTWHIRGSVSQEIIGPITADTMDGDAITIELWIDQESNDLLRVQLSEPTDTGIDDPATWQMDLRDHDEPVTIEPPV